MTVFVILAVCAAAFLILARPFRSGAAARPSAVPEPGSAASPDRTAGPGATEAPPARTHLLDEKDRLFQALADLRFDYEAGKLSREDYEDEDARLRARAAALLHDLERDETP